MKDNLIPVTPSAYPYPLLIKHLLHTPLAQYPEQEIVYSDVSRYTYRAMFDRVGRLASGLAELGVRPGDTVAVMDWDSHRYLEAYFAVPMMGAVLQTVNVRLSPEQILYTIHHAEARVLLVNTEFLPLLKLIRDKLGTVRKYVLLTDGASPDHVSGFDVEYEDMLAAANSDFDFPDFDENTRATTFYTTGTTGNPKGVYFSHRQLMLHTMGVLCAIAAAGEHQSFLRRDVYMPLSPMFHVHTWGFPYIATLMGVKQVYPGRYIAEHLVDLIQREKVTFSHAVPTVLHMILSAKNSRDADFSKLKMVIGGSALSQALAKAAHDRGIDIFAGYGMSETCPVLSLGQLKPQFVNADTEKQLSLRRRAGLALPFVEIRVVDENMKDRPHDGKSVGEVVVRAPWLTQGYLHDSANSEKLWAGGYLHTQDIGYIDEDGYLQITDRVKDVIKTGGEWISSLDLENLVSQHPAVSEVAVIGIKDEKWSERPLVLVVPKPGSTVTERDIIEHLKKFRDAGTISNFAVPERVLFVEQIDKTSVGKIDKKLLREKFAK